MRIIYSGILGSAAVTPISVGGFWTGFFSLVFLFPFIFGIRGVVKYIRLKKHGIKTYATIGNTQRLHSKCGYYNVKQYIYFADGNRFGGIIQTGSKSKKYADKQKIEVRYDKDHPEKHIRVRDSLWESIGILFLSGMIFLSMFIMFLSELMKCF